MALALKLTYHFCVSESIDCFRPEVGLYLVGLPVGLIVKFGGGGVRGFTVNVRLKPMAI